MSFRKIRETIDAIKGTKPAENSQQPQDTASTSVTSTQNVITIKPVPNPFNVSIIESDSALSSSH